MTPQTITRCCYGYVRVSTSKQDLSVEAQTQALERAAEFHAGTPVLNEIFSDPDTSGSIPFIERQGGRQLLEAARLSAQAGENPTVLVTKVDRLGRDTVDVSQTATLFDRLGIRLVLLDINVDTRAPMGRAFMQIAAVFAELERARIRERIQTTLDLKRSQNLVVGSVPYGWDDRPTGATNKQGKPVRELVDNPAEQAEIIAMAHKLKSGWSLTAIAADLNRRGIPTKRRGEKLNLRDGDRTARIKVSTGLWQAGQIKKILTNKSTQALLATHEN